MIKGNLAEPWKKEEREECAPRCRSRDLLRCRRRPRWSRSIWWSSAKTTTAKAEEETVAGGRWSGTRSGDQERSSVEDALPKSRIAKSDVTLETLMTTKATLPQIYVECPLPSSSTLL